MFCAAGQRSDTAQRRLVGMHTHFQVVICGRSGYHDTSSVVKQCERIPDEAQ